MTGTLDMRAAYAATLRRHAHELIARGYEQMDRRLYARWEEPAITGELVRAMRKFLESGDAPPWVVWYAIADDPPVDGPGRFGKSRPRVDIEFERTGVRGARPCLRFEAKRLGRTSGHTVGSYLGAEGMGCFTSGKYPLTHGEAGMLGYIQSGREQDWSDKIKAALAKREKEYAVLSPPFCRQKICDLKHTYVSHHTTTTGLVDIMVHHVLLRFC